MRCWNWEQFPDAFGTRLQPDFQRILPGTERFPDSTRVLFADFFAVAFTVAPPAVGTFHGNCRAKDGGSIADAYDPSGTTEDVGKNTQMVEDPKPNAPAKVMFSPRAGLRPAAVAESSSPAASEFEVVGPAVEMGPPSPAACEHLLRS